MTTRRDMMTASAGLFAFAAATSVDAKTVKAPVVEAMTAAEKANVDLVKAFLGEFVNPNLDFNAVMAKYMSPTCSVRWADYLPAVYGPAAASIQAQALMPKGSSLAVKYLNVFAKGPLVATSRIDTVTNPGKTPQAFPCAGVHVFKDGKLVEYADWILSA